MAAFAALKSFIGHLYPAGLHGSIAPATHITPRDWLELDTS